MSSVILVTGGTISGIGKGLVASSLGYLLGDVTFLKIDPYLNVDAGSLGPSEHGEVFVLPDGTETDLDLGNYQRYCDIELNQENTLTTGRLYSDIARSEKQNKYLGQTIQIVPHVSDYIEERVLSLLKRAKHCIIELGGSGSDPENLPFVLSLKRFQIKHGLFHIHISLLPEIGEYKTKPIQSSVQCFSQMGLVPNLIIARTLERTPVPQKFLDKIFNLTLIPTINIHNVDNLYDIPKQLLGINKYFSIKPYKLEYPIVREVMVSIIGKYNKAVDSYHSLIEGLKIAGLSLGINVNIVFNRTNVDVMVVAGGFGIRGIEDKIFALQRAREDKIPCLGICLGMQCMILEYYRNVLGINGNSAEFSETNIIIPKLGKNMIKGSLPVTAVKNSRIADIYKNTTNEIFRHKYGVKIIDGDLMKATAYCGDVVAAVELSEHPFYMGVQYHPEFKGSLKSPHPLFLHLLSIV